MVKEGRRKRKKAEKAKTQLKTSLKSAKNTKKLPKGLNEVRVDKWNIKQLVVPGQLGFGVDEDEHVGELDKRLKPFKDLLSKVTHHRKSVRSEGVKGLRDWVKYRPDQITQNIANIMPKVLNLITDRESGIRRECRELVASILALHQYIDLSPLGDMICTHLGCALAHVDSEIQRDALKLLDCVIELSPGVIARHQHKLQILPSCVEQISARRVLQSSTSSSAKTLNLSSGLSDKITSQRWRLNVFERLQKILQIAVNEHSRIEHSSIKCVRRAFEQERYMSLYQRMPHLDDVGTSMAQVEAGGHATISVNASSTAHFACTLMPLLHEAWGEASTLPKAGETNAEISLEAQSVTESISSIVLLLRQGLEADDLALEAIILDSKVEDFCRNILMHLLSFFQRLETAVTYLLT